MFVYAFFIERFCQCCRLCGNIFFELVIIVKLFDLGGTISVAKVDGSHQGQSCRCAGDVQTGLNQLKKSCHVTIYVYSFNLTSGGVVNIRCYFKLAPQSGNHIKQSLLLANKFVDALPQSMKRREGKECLFDFSKLWKISILKIVITYALRNTDIDTHILCFIVRV